MTKNGSLFIVSAPSGAGKTTILKKILEDLPGIVFSVSHTTRTQRPGEQDGIDYHFVSRQEFLRLQDRDAFLEWAEVHGNLYGTSAAAVERLLAEGLDVILDIDVQGGCQLRDRETAASFIFIAPPSFEELARRLIGRLTESAETLKIRLANARVETAMADTYDYLVVNDNLEDAVNTVKAIIVATRSRYRRSAAGTPIRIE